MFLRVLSLLVIICFGCGSNDKNLIPEREVQECGVSNPAENLQWLKDEIEKNGYKNPSSYWDIYIYASEYKGQTVFFTSMCCPTCGMLPPEVKDCQGKSLGRLGTDLFSSDLQNQRIIWQKKNGVCQG